MTMQTQERIMSSTLTAAPGTAGATGAAAGEGPAKKSKKLLIVVPLVLALVAGAAWFFLLRGNGEPAKKAEPKPGVVVTLDSVNINLADGHYLKLKLALQ